VPRVGSLSTRNPGVHHDVDQHLDLGGSSAGR
jgi:hypothetical protein